MILTDLFHDQVKDIIINSNKILKKSYYKYKIEGITINTNQNSLEYVFIKVHDLIISRLKKINESYQTNAVIIDHKYNNLNSKIIDTDTYMWFIDVIDDKEKFLDKKENFYTSIALCRNGYNIYGIIGQPILDTIYIGSSIYDTIKINTKNDSISKVIMNDYKLIDENLKIITQNDTNINTNTNFLKLIERKYFNPIINFTKYISIIDFIEKKMNVYYQLSKLPKYKICAAHAIIKYSQGFVFNLNSLESIIYNNDLIIDKFICYGKIV